MTGVLELFWTFEFARVRFIILKMYYWIDPEKHNFYISGSKRKLIPGEIKKTFLLLF